MKIFLNPFVFIALIAVTVNVMATPEEDKKTFQQFYSERFSNIDLDEFSNGVYALDKDARSQWEAMSDFPPYEDALEEGEKLFNTPFENGNHYASCFQNDGQNIRQNYPLFDTQRNTVVTLELAINECRIHNNEQPLPYKKGDIAKISAYMASTSEGSATNVSIPDTKEALSAYQAGKQFFYTKHGQLNFSCANCHVQYAGRKARSETLSTALGQTTHFPVYRLKWEALGTLHRRFDSCLINIRATPLEAQSETYKNLEYFLSYMSNGLPINGPASRK
jgi:L-cysteine S-thiosulfotransferase